MVHLIQLASPPCHNRRSMQLILWGSEDELHCCAISLLQVFLTIALVEDLSINRTEIIKSTGAKSGLVSSINKHLATSAPTCCLGIFIAVRGGLFCRGRAQLKSSKPQLKIFNKRKYPLSTVRINLIARHH